MISDTLHDALVEIERYQKSMPQCYDGLQDEIGKVKAAMDALRAYLDFPPGDGRYPIYDAAMRRLRTEIAGIAVDGLAAAIENVTSSWPAPSEADVTTDSRPSRLNGLGYDPEEVLARAIDVWTQAGDRDQPSSDYSEVDTKTHEVRLRNINGFLATYKIGPAGEIWQTPDGKEGA